MSLGADPAQPFKPIALRPNVPPQQPSSTSPKTTSAFTAASSPKANALTPDNISHQKASFAMLLQNY